MTFKNFSWDGSCRNQKYKCIRVVQNTGIATAAGRAEDSVARALELNPGPKRCRLGNISSGEVGGVAVVVGDLLFSAS